MNWLVDVQEFIVVFYGPILHIVMSGLLAGAMCLAIIIVVRSISEQ
jgi:hypothetical protein